METNKLKAKILETSRSRILYFIEKQGIKGKDFLDETGLKKGFIDKSHVNSSASDKFLSKILEKYPSLSAEWLLTGDGDMMNEKPRKLKEHILHNSQDELIISLRTINDLLEEKSLYLKKLLDIKENEVKTLEKENTKLQQLLNPKLQDKQKQA